VKVNGVGVEVANRFCVGAGVILGVGVRASTTGTGVGVRNSFVTSDSEAQLESRIDRRKRQGIFFIAYLLHLDTEEDSWIEDFAIRHRYVDTGNH
jgi:hypothetical protein